MTQKDKPIHIDEKTIKLLDELIEAVSKKDSSKDKLQEDFGLKYKKDSEGKYELQRTIQSLGNDFPETHIFEQLYTITTTFEEHGLGIALKKLCDEELDTHEIHNPKFKKEIQDLQNKSLHVRKSLVEIIHVLAGIAEILHFFI
jgi:hypothetical protein